MPYLLSKQKTRLGPRGADWCVELKPGVRSRRVSDEDVKRLLAHGKGGGRRLQRAGLLVVIPDETVAAAAEAEDDAPTAPDPFAVGIPEDLSELSVAKARPLIEAAEDLDTVRRWAQAEAARTDAAPRAGVLDPLQRRWLELGGEPPADDPTADPSGGDGEGG